jgi:hypothetical protein
MAAASDESDAVDGADGAAGEDEGVTAGEVEVLLPSLGGTLGGAAATGGVLVVGVSPERL